MESFNSRFRDEFLHFELFTSLVEVKLWQNSAESSTTFADRIRLSRGVLSWKSSSNGRRPDYPNSFHKNGSNKEGTSRDPYRHGVDQLLSRRAQVGLLHT